MTDKETWRFMELFRWYRDAGELPPEEHEEFKTLCRLYKAWKTEEAKGK